MNRRDRFLWKTLSEKYPHHCYAPTAIKPPNVPGAHASVLWCTGWRVWGWRTERERDAFLSQYLARRDPP